MDKKFTKTVTTRSYVINGKEYTSLDDMPPDVRKEYEAFENMVTEDRDNNGTSDIFEGSVFKNSFFDRSMDFFHPHSGFVKNVNATRVDESDDPFDEDDWEAPRTKKKTQPQYTSAVKKGGSGGKDLVILILVLLVIALVVLTQFN